MSANQQNSNGTNYGAALIGGGDPHNYEVSLPAFRNPGPMWADRRVYGQIPHSPTGYISDGLSTDGSPTELESATKAQVLSMISRARNSTTHQLIGDPFKDWGNTDFNLLEFIGTEESPLDSNPESFDANDDDDMHKKDVQYQNFQYNALAFDPPMGKPFGPVDLLDHVDPADLLDHVDPVVLLDLKLAQLAEPNNTVVVTDSHYAEPPNVYEQGQMGATYAVNGDRGLYNQQLDGSLMPSTSRHSGGSNIAVKVEPAAGDYVSSPDLPFLDDLRMIESPYFQYDSESDRGQSMEPAGGPMRNYQPRKYRVKSENEKKNPVYKVKRERNNDAVRRSRDKAKKAQEEKDALLFQLEQENPILKMQIKRLTERMQTMEKSLLQMKQQCRCNARRLLQ